jgi:hypothetical protein
MTRAEGATLKLKALEITLQMAATGFKFEGVDGIEFAEKLYDWAVYGIKPAIKND